MAGRFGVVAAVFFTASRVCAQAPAPAATAAFPTAPPDAAPPPPPVRPPSGPPPPAYWAPPPPVMYYAPVFPPNTPRPEPKRVRSVSITGSPIRLVLPIFIVEAMLEARPVNHVGLAVFGGVGHATWDKSSGGLREVGVDLLFYPLQAFDRFVFGGEFRYAHIRGVTGDIPGVLSVNLIGPLVGYKLITTNGFTLFAHGGVQHYSANGQADSPVRGAPSSRKGWVPLLNFNMGWSF
jgi:hypothetical protein